MRLGALILALVALQACGSPCGSHKVVQTTSKGLTLQLSTTTVPLYDVEIDDGHVYRGPFASPLSTGREVEVCEVTSKIDNSKHYSVHYGSYTPNVQRLR